jgi:hypothetical protein
MHWDEGKPWMHWVVIERVVIERLYRFVTFMVADAADLRYHFENVFDWRSGLRRGEAHRPDPDSPSP